MCQKYGMGVLSWSPLAGGWLSGAFGPGKENTSRRSAMLPAPLRHDRARATSRSSTPSRQLNEVADGAGLSLIQLALGFVLEHPAVTSPIIGPRTMEHLESQLPALELRLGTDVLDRIDEIVPPGTDLNDTDVGWVPAAIADKRPAPATPLGAQRFGDGAARAPGVQVGLGHVVAVSVVDEDLFDPGTELVGERGGAGLVVEGAHVDPALDAARPHALPADGCAGPGPRTTWARQRVNRG